MAAIVDTSVWIDILGGVIIEDVEDALASGTVVVPPLVVAELLSGDMTPRQREALGELLQDFPLHETPLDHWMRVGELRRILSRKGLKITIPDAHVAQCALDLNGALFSRDDVFARIAAHTSLRLAQLR